MSCYRMESHSVLRVGFQDYQTWNEVAAMVALKPVLRVGRTALLVFLASAAGAQSPRQLPAPENPTGIPAEYEKQLQMNPQSSLSYYQLAREMFAQHRYQASANACRSALRGDGDPSW